MYDAIIIGARCAGSPLAMLLARKGYKILVLDRATFPSDAISGHYIHQTGVARLKRWGLLERVAATGCPPVNKVTFDLGDFALKGTPTPLEGTSEAYAPRRIVLDQILLNAATEAGAEVRQAFTVEEISLEEGRVCGIRGHAKGGRSVSERARIVVGADGANSLVARAVRPAHYNTRPALTCIYYSYWSGVEIEGPELYPRDGRFIVACPTNDGLTNIAVMWPTAEFPLVRSDIEGHFMKSLDQLAPTLAARAREGRRVERFYGMNSLPNFFRKSHGAGWALAGDAGYHKDPVTAQGITDAFHSADLLAEALDAGFREERPMHKALARYERQRDRACLPMYEMTCQLATLAPPSLEMQHLFAALRWTNVETNNFLGVIAGTVPVREFFSPANIRRITAAPENYFPSTCDMRYLQTV